MSEKKQRISRATMSRFPIYLKALRTMGQSGKESFLSSELAEVTHIQDTTIRRDFGFLPQENSLGKRGYGYDTQLIIDALSNVLGLGLDEPIILVGVGNLGSAILKYNRWKYTVGKIVYAYDRDQNMIGERFGVEIKDINDLEETFPKDCKIAILCVSDDVQAIVDRLVALGIKGIVDFTHNHFIVPEGVEVQNVDVVVAIQELELKMKAKASEEE
ncbi:redox-sensing transcriptional repressor Rex [Intestinibaculum porci]|jgi:redox-sensing transcriptional repressor|uniref:redox-sensing transcriptional repressor Rex n=1 Tax=Intestinibaculum porci TaxID=2487118 RepID=UPI000EE51D99|nr:redox-sensing transcriptional repressor Rex [Intestinibaculum porci]MDD6350352.1 redox-sensing transcriptional repressor Rex [Intestinibaculum porci]MDD6423449.1 redox-sensing transcriptional repressor Rex [Intestinibaculum porci]HAN57403.1 redox-sensing transcriptional repressor Rex [Erysipelotrichaceae bacterium]